MRELTFPDSSPDDTVDPASRDANDGIEAMIRPWMAQMLAKEPARRFRDATEVERGLRVILAKVERRPPRARAFVAMPFSASLEPLWQCIEAVCLEAEVLPVRVDRAPLDPAAASQRVAALGAKNGAKTPIGASLEKAAEDLKSVKGEKLIVLITDGEETCGGDPAAAIARLRKAGIDTRVSIVGFALEDEVLAATFRRWSDAGGGAFFAAKDAAGLDRSLTEALRPSFEVMNAQGQVLARGIVGGDAVAVPAGKQSVRLTGRAKAAKPAIVKPKETSSVSF